MLSVMSLRCRPAARPTQPQGTVRIHQVEGQADDHQSRATVKKPVTRSTSRASSAMVTAAGVSSNDQLADGWSSHTRDLSLDPSLRACTDTGDGLLARTALVVES